MKYKVKNCPGRCVFPITSFPITFGKSKSKCNDAHILIKDIRYLPEINASVFRNWIGNIGRGGSSSENTNLGGYFAYKLTQWCRNWGGRGGY